MFKGRVNVEVFVWEDEFDWGYSSNFEFWREKYSRPSTLKNSNQGDVIRVSEQLKSTQEISKHTFS
jgi:hypothetical protein